MNNTITGALEFFAFVTILAAGAFLWFATPAHAGCIFITTNAGTQSYCN